MKRTTSFSHYDSSVLCKQQKQLFWKKISTVTLTLACVSVMVGLVAFSFPLYRWYCQFDGYGGTPKRVTQVPASSVSGDKVQSITVRFDANTNSNLPWLFKPLQKKMVVRVGEPTIALYWAHNTSDSPITGTATFNVTPTKAGPFFNKIACFCFREQTLAPKQSVEMPVTFFVDPAIITNPQTSELTTITLSYTFFRSVGDSDSINRRS